MKISVRCLCGRSAKIDIPGDLMTFADRRALACKAMAERGWIYRDVPMGKSTVTMMCDKCRPAILRLDADFSPEEVTPKSYEEDLR